jgi:hypothetical protein
MDGPPPDVPRRSTASRVGAAVLVALGCGVWLVWAILIASVAYLTVPILVSFYENEGLDLPASVRPWVGATDTFSNYWYLILPAWLLVTATAMLLAATSSRPSAPFGAAVFAAGSGSVALVAFGYMMLCLLHLAVRGLAK